MKFKNKKGKELKTTISDEIMDKMADLIEQELKDKEITYIREGTNFRVNQKVLDYFFEAQRNANEKLISQGIITMDMLANDFKSNF